MTWKGSIASCSMLPSRLPFIKSVMASVAKTVVCQKWELLFIKPAVKVNEQCCWHTRLTASNTFETKMLDAIKHVGDDSFVFQQDSAPVRSTQSNCCSAKLSTSFLLSYGSVTVRRLIPPTTRFTESYSSEFE